MRFLNITASALFASALFFTACTAGSSSPAEPGTVSAVVQDLAVDPAGMTTVLSLPSAPGSVTPGNFEADGGQVALSVSVSGSQATVAWDEIVNSEDQVRVVGIGSISSDFSAVTASDMTAPTFAVSAGTQVAGLGGDSFQLTFTGPRLVESLVEDGSKWSVFQDGKTYNLAGSTIVYNPGAGTASVTLGSGASLHAVYTVTATGILSVANVLVPGSAIGGTASGDVVAPTLTSVEQDLALDEYGRVVVFTFSEAIDPVAGVYLSNFIAGLPVFASSVSQVSAGVLRVVFTEPMIPTVDTVLLQNIKDSHGNSFVSATVPVAQGSSVANAFAADPELRSVENALNDVVVVTFDQAIDPTDAVDSAHWSLEIASTPFDLSTATFTYDFLAKSLNIDLGVDVANGTGFELEPASGNAPLDIDGDSFADTFAGLVSGDSGAPAALVATQNRTVASDGRVVDVSFSEDLDETSAETSGNWVASGTQNVSTVVLQSNLRTVRIQFDDLILPGQTTLAMSGITDIAGNAITPIAAQVVLSTDTIIPALSGPIADAAEGANNDKLSLVFSDDMIGSEVEVATSWSLESPIGTPLSTAGATVVYNSSQKSAILTLNNGVNIPNREDYSLVLTSMRDFGGNTVDPTPITGLVTGDINYPGVDSVWVDGSDDTILHLRMTEPFANHADYYEAGVNPLALTTYLLRDGGGAVVGTPSAIAVSGGFVQLSMQFAGSIVAGTHTLDVRGLTDLAGNQMFPANTLAIIADDVTAPALEGGSSTALAVSSEENDVVTVVFDRDMGSWGMTDASHYLFTVGGDPVTLREAVGTFDGARTVTFVLNKVGAGDVQLGSNHTLTVSGLTSQWGVVMSGASVDTLVGTGDSTLPAVAVGDLRLDASDAAVAVIIELSEAVRSDDGADVTAIEISSVNPATAAQVGRRTSRAVFGAVSVGQTVDVSMRDLAGNLGSVSQLVTAADVAGATVSSVEAAIVPGAGGDSVSIHFSRPVNTTSALNYLNYTVDQGGNAIDLSGATPRYESATNTVRFDLPEGVNLENGVQVHVVASAVEDFASLAMVAADELGNVTGDTTAPSLAQAFINRRSNALGFDVEVTFSEDVDPILPTIPAQWSSDGGQFPISVTILDGGVARIRFATPLTGGEQLTFTGLEDLAGNVSGAVTVSVVP